MEKTMRCFILIIAIFLFSSSFAQDKEVQSKPSIEFRMMIEQETAMDIKNNDIQKSEWMFDPEALIKFNNRVKLFVQLRLYTEFSDVLEPGRADYSNYSKASRPMHLGNLGQLELRELYADITIGSSYWRIGKQQVVWGEMDGFKVLDRLNPMSFREFILDDFDDSRIPLWAIKGEVKLGDFQLTTYWSPDLSAHQLPTLKGAYSPLQNMSAHDGVEIIFSDLEHPNRLIKNSDIGFQVATRFNGWDLTFNYLYQFTKEPVLKKVLNEENLSLQITPLQKREHLIGGSFGNTWGLIGLRGEVAYFPKKYISTTDISFNGIDLRSQIMSGVAIDYFGISNGIFTFQWFGDLLSDSQKGSIFQRDRMIHTITLMHTQFLMNQRIEIKAFGGYRIGEKGLMLDLKMAYSLKDNFKIWLGGDLFVAGNSGIISPYENRDRIMAGFEWGIQ